MRILICGASIAGPSAAFWLARAGHEVTVVERAPGIRQGGYAVDIRGAAREVVNRMGLLEQARALQTDTLSNCFVDRTGKRFARLPRGFGVIDPEDIEILRGDLAMLLFEVTRERVCYRFGESISALEESPEQVEVELTSGARDSWDLVIGADGVHSRVRTLAFCAESEVVLDLGSAMAIGTVPNALGLVREQISHSDVQRIASVKSCNRDRELKVCLFYPMTRAAFDPENVPLQRQQARQAFSSSGWELAPLAAQLAEATDFYADLTCQIRMPRHCTGRVALVGDAGYCPSPLTGQGTSLALVGAHVLAHELATTTSVSEALQRYDTTIAAFARTNQELAQKMAGGFVASSRSQLFLRNALLRALSHLPGASFVVARAMGGVRAAANAIALPPTPVSASHAA